MLVHLYMYTVPYKHLIPNAEVSPSLRKDQEKHCAHSGPEQRSRTAPPLSGVDAAAPLGHRPPECLQRACCQEADGKNEMRRHHNPAPVQGLCVGRRGKANVCEDATRRHDHTGGLSWTSGSGVAEKAAQVVNGDPGSFQDARGPTALPRREKSCSCDSAEVQSRRSGPRDEEGLRCSQERGACHTG